MVQFCYVQKKKFHFHWHYLGKKRIRFDAKSIYLFQCDNFTVKKRRILVD